MHRKILLFPMPDAKPHEMERFAQTLIKLSCEHELPYLFIIINKSFATLSIEDLRIILEKVIQKYDEP